MAGVLYEELYGRSFKTSDKENAFKVYDLLIKRYPKSKYRCFLLIGMGENRIITLSVPQGMARPFPGFDWM